MRIYIYIEREREIEREIHIHFLRAQTNDPHESRSRRREGALRILKSKALSASDLATFRRPLVVV